MDYDYREAMREDVRYAIKEYEQYVGCPVFDEFADKEEAFEILFDMMWTDDSVTGNGSGSYTFSTYKAEEYLCHNWELLKEALEEFGNAFDEGGAEQFDVTIRCYLLPEILAQVLDELFEEA